TGLKLAAWSVFNTAVLTQPFPANSTAHGAIGDRLPEGSRRSGNASIEQVFPLWNRALGSMGAKVSYIGDRLGAFTATDDRDVFRAYARIDLNGGVHLSSWTVNLFVNNLADKRGVIGKNPFTSNSVIYIQPRTVGFSVSRRF